MKRAKLNVVRIQLVRDHAIKWEHEERYTAPRQIVDAIRIFLDDTDREHMLAILLDNKNRISSITEISVGSLNQSVVHPREVFKPAILANSAAVILAHNHPSGDASPSSEDIAITRRLKEAGDILGIKVMDHIIVGDGTDSYVSFSESGLM
jgi:DNA repair protein RadC